MGGFRDIFPWPYDWSTDLADPVRYFQQDLLDQGIFTSGWTYKNHFRFVPVAFEDQHRWVLDLFQAGSVLDRDQMPPAKGDEVAAYVVGEWGEELTVLIWKFRYWMPGVGWREYRGAQGDFVSNIHIEFDRPQLQARYDASQPQQPVPTP